MGESDMNWQGQSTSNDYYFGYDNDRDNKN